MYPTPKTETGVSGNMLINQVNTFKKSRNCIQEKITEDDDQLQMTDDCSGADDVYNGKAMESVCGPTISCCQNFNSKWTLTHSSLMDPSRSSSTIALILRLPDEHKSDFRRKMSTKPGKCTHLL